MLSKFYLPTDVLKIWFKRILNFTLKQLLHVSVQSPSSGSLLFELAKVIVIKIIHRCSWFGGVAEATPPNQLRSILTEYFNNYNFSKLK
jgi:hypothetical protein